MRRAAKRLRVPSEDAVGTIDGTIDAGASIVRNRRRLGDVPLQCAAIMLYELSKGVRVAVGDVDAPLLATASTCAATLNCMLIASTLNCMLIASTCAATLATLTTVTAASSAASTSATSASAAASTSATKGCLQELVQEADVARQMLKLGAKLLQAVRDHNGAFRLASSDAIELCLDVRADRRQHKLRVNAPNRLSECQPDGRRQSACN